MCNHRELYEGLRLIFAKSLKKVKERNVADCLATIREHL